MPGRVPRVVSCAILVFVMAVYSGCARFKPPPNTLAVRKVMRTTGYCKCGKCCGWKRNWYGRPVYAYGPNKGKRKKVGVTASGTKAKPGTIAADVARYPFGTIMYVDGYGWGRVEDRGRAIQGEHIDLFFTSHREATAWGNRQSVVVVYLPRHLVSE